MNAMLVDEMQNLVWAEVADPVIKEDEVLVKVYAVGVNRADLLQRRGEYPSPEGCPDWMGLEIAGEVIACGSNVARWRVGDRVCALLGGGGYAELVAVKENMCMPIPKGLSIEEAAALPEVYATAYLNLVLEGHLQRGQTAFIPAGASGLASAAIPMAKALGARVITSVRKMHQVDRIAHLGADRIICTADESVEKVLAEEEANSTPVNVSMDCLCGDTMGKSLPYMARYGYWIVISTLAGTETNIPLRPLLTKGLHIVGSTLRSRTPQFKAQLLEKLVQNVWPMIECGAVKPSIHKVLPMADAEEAHAILQRGDQVGKVILSLTK